MKSKASLFTIIIQRKIKKQNPSSPIYVYVTRAISTPSNIDQDDIKFTHSAVK